MVRDPREAAACVRTRHSTLMQCSEMLREPGFSPLAACPAVRQSTPQDRPARRGSHGSAAAVYYSPLTILLGMTGDPWPPAMHVPLTWVCRLCAQSMSGLAQHVRASIKPAVSGRCALLHRGIRSETLMAAIARE